MLLSDRSEREAGAPRDACCSSKASAGASSGAQLLLAMRTLERRPRSREALAARLWPDVLDESARVVADPDQVWTDVQEPDFRLQAGDLEEAFGHGGRIGLSTGSARAAIRPTPQLRNPPCQGRP